MYIFLGETKSLSFNKVFNSLSLCFVYLVLLDAIYIYIRMHVSNTLHHWMDLLKIKPPKNIGYCNAERYKCPPNEQLFKVNELWEISIF
jgi:hypothetical protein